MLLSLLTSNPTAFIIIALALVLSLAVHEFAHAYTADRLGDPTPRRYGRVTLNPIAHLDPVGTLLLQGLTLPWLIRALGVANDFEEQEDAREIAAVRERSREAGKAYLRRMREKWAEQRGQEQLGAFDAWAKRLVRTESDTESARTESEQRPRFEQFVALSKGWLSVRRRLLLEERDAGNLNEEVMRELIRAMDAEELALDTRAAAVQSRD